MKFVDRIDETARLKDALTRKRASLIVLYGRRRLGKSTLIKRVLSDRDIYFLADRSECQYQRGLLAKVIAQVFPDFDKLIFPDWESLFKAVNYRTEKQFTLCLDEFSYLVEQALNAHFSEYVSAQWEKLCRDVVTGNMINGVVYGKGKRWWGSVLNEDKRPEQVEFDVVAESLDKKYLLVGEKQESIV